MENGLSEEVQSHLQNEIKKNVATFMTPAEARDAALGSFGGVAQIRERCKLREESG